MLEPLVVRTLGPLFEGRVYPDTAAGDTPLPFVIFQQVGGVATVFVDGRLPDKQNARVQITVWAKGREQASVLIGKVQAALCAAPVFALPSGGPIARRDSVTGFKGAEQDFSVWYSTS